VYLLARGPLRLQQRVTVKVERDLWVGVAQVLAQRLDAAAVR
jgi:hypothetical protein